MRLTKQCYGCKQQFLKKELVDYASSNAKILHSYCPNCLREKQARERFSNKVCAIFGIKTPGPRIWTERKRIQETYGYTDDVIVDCLDYIYNVVKKDKIAESLCLVTPNMVDKMIAYKKRQQYEGIKITQAAATEMKEFVVPIKENQGINKTNWDPDLFLDFD